MLYWEVHGRDGPYVLFVHGLLSSRAQWRPNLPAFTKRLRPVVVELLGHGRSPAPERPEAYASSAYPGYFEEIRERLGVDRWYIVGQSLGAALTLRYALEFPERIVAHAFTNTNAAFATPERAERLRASEETVRDLLVNGRAALERHPLNPTRSRTLSPEVKEAFRPDVALHDPRGIALTMLHTTAGCSLRGRFEKNTVPTLMVVGERETSFEDARRYAEATIPHLTVRALDAGHAVNLGAAAGFNAAVLGFFDTHLASGR